jgi:hypothetical protein
MDEVRDNRYAHTVLSSCEFHENRRRKCHTFLIGVKNAMVKAVLYVSEPTVWSFVAVQQILQVQWAEV